MAANSFARGDGSQSRMDSEGFVKRDHLSICECLEVGIMSCGETFRSKQKV